MSRHVPVLTEVVVRAWGLDDPRVLSHLRAENTPGRGQRAKAIRRRAKAAGWPTFDMEEAKKAATTAVRRLEGVDFIWNGDRHHERFQVSAYESRSRRDPLAVPWYAGYLPDVPASIFDE